MHTNTKNLLKRRYLLSDKKGGEIARQYQRRSRKRIIHPILYYDIMHTVCGRCKAISTIKRLQFFDEEYQQAVYMPQTNRATVHVT